MDDHDGESLSLANINAHNKKTRGNIQIQRKKVRKEHRQPPLSTDPGPSRICIREQVALQKLGVRIQVKEVYLEETAFTSSISRRTQVYLPPLRRAILLV